MDGLFQNIGIAFACLVICYAIGVWHWRRGNRKRAQESMVLCVVRLVSGEYDGLSPKWQRGTAVVRRDALEFEGRVQIVPTQFLEISRNVPRSLRDARSMTCVTAQLQGGAVAEMAIPRERVSWVMESLIPRE